MANNQINGIDEHILNNYYECRGIVTDSSFQQVNDAILGDDKTSLRSSVINKIQQFFNDRIERCLEEYEKLDRKKEKNEKFLKKERLLILLTETRAIIEFDFLKLNLTYDGDPVFKDEMAKKRFIYFYQMLDLINTYIEELWGSVNDIGHGFNTVFTNTFKDPQPKKVEILPFKHTIKTFVDPYIKKYIKYVFYTSYKKHNNNLVYDSIWDEKQYMRFMLLRLANNKILKKDVGIFINIIAEKKSTTVNGFTKDDKSRIVEFVNSIELSHAKDIYYGLFKKVLKNVDLPSNKDTAFNTYYKNDDKYKNTLFEYIDLGYRGAYMDLAINKYITKRLNYFNYFNFLCEKTTTVANPGTPVIKFCELCKKELTGFNYQPILTCVYKGCGKNFHYSCYQAATKNIKKIEGNKGVKFDLLKFKCNSHMCHQKKCYESSLYFCKTCETSYCEEHSKTNNIITHQFICKKCKKNYKRIK